MINKLISNISVKRREVINSTKKNYYFLISIAWRKPFNHKPFLHYFFFYYIWTFNNEHLCLHSQHTNMVSIVFTMLVIADTDVLLRSVMFHSNNCTGFGLSGQSLLAGWAALLPPLLPGITERMAACLGKWAALSLLLAMLRSATAVCPRVHCIRSGRLLRTEN